ncbi:MAG: ABC transporter permease [Chloroflexi bacterium]|nr:ABC transporter permease [Chloroflexota bacterium]
MAKIDVIEGAPAERAGPSGAVPEVVIAARRRGPTGVRRFVRSSPLGTIALLFLLVVIVMAILADVITYWDPLLTDYGSTRAAPSAMHVLGTDHLGRDVWSRIVTGARISLYVAFVAVLAGDGVGLVWGVVSGYFGGRVDMVSQRILDALLSFPGLILAMLLLVGLGAGLSTVIIAIAVTRIPLSTRVIRSVALTTKSLAYVEAARTVGASPIRILARHVAPQCIAPFLVIVSANIGVAITTEAGLSFLGIGIPPPSPTWGNMLGGVLAESFKPPWWLVVYPGLALTLTVLAANLFGDALRDFLDPRLRGRLSDL